MSCSSLYRHEIDELCNKVCDSEYIHNLHLGRSWILPQMVEMGFDSKGVFSTELYVEKIKHFDYQKMWDIVIRNVKAMQSMKDTDPEACMMRAQWWNKEVFLALATQDLALMKKYEGLGRVYENSTGGPYVTIWRLMDGKGNRVKRQFFLKTPPQSSKWNSTNSKTVKDLFDGFRNRIEAIRNATSVEELNKAMLDYYNHRFAFRPNEVKFVVPESFIKAYAGDGAYSAMMTMVKHLNLCHNNDMGIALTRDECIADIKAKAELYREDGMKLLDYCREKFFDRSRGGVFDYNEYHSS